MQSIRGIQVYQFVWERVCRSDVVNNKFYKVLKVISLDIKMNW